MMSKSSSIEAVLHREGGHTNDPDDPGKETYCGISRRYNKNWKGWAFVDQKNWAVAKFWVQAFYSDYWDTMNVDALCDPLLQDSVYDYGVNEGREDAVRILQETLRYMGRKVSLDGDLGLQTAASCNYFFGAGQGPELRRLYAGKKTVAYHEKVVAVPAKKKYLFGWVLRAWEQVR